MASVKKQNEKSLKNLQSFHQDMWKMWLVCVCVCTYVLSHVWLCMDCSPTRILCPWDSPSKNTGVVAMPSSRGSSHPRIKFAYLASPGLAGGFFTTMAPGKPQKCSKAYLKDWLRCKLVSLGAERWDRKLATTTGDFEWCMKKDFSTDL